MASKSVPPIVLVVPREAAGARLDRFLVSALAALEGAPSRAELQRWIEHRRVKVDGVTRKAADKLREGSQVAVDPEAQPLTSALAEEGIEFDVLYIDDDLVVLNKPAGLVVHPARGHETGTLVNGLLARGVFDSPDGEDEIDDRVSLSIRVALPSSEDLSTLLGPEPEPESEKRVRPGIVHRLDKGTSGVMVVARTPRAREILKAQFSAHTIEREYEAICTGDVRAQTFDTLHGRHATDRLRFTSRVRQGKRAVTHVRPIERFAHGGATHVLCTLETGRTHQIRMHLSEAKTAILGDPIYGSTPKNPVIREVSAALSHQALHARVLGFIHPTSGKPVRFAAPPPPDFQVALTALRAIP